MTNVTEHLLVATMDFGTAYSGYAFSFRDTPDDIKMNQAWNAGSQQLISLKAPTCVLLTPEKKFKAFGYEAENQYVTLSRNNQHKPWYFFQQFKMRLYDSNTLSRRTMIEAIDGKPMPAMTIVAMSIRYMKDHMIELIQKSVKELSLDDINFVITIPAIWDDSAKQFMTEAATEAGLDERRVTLSLEPEAASIFCQTVPTSKLEGGEGFTAARSGTQYMIVDLGGGTIDITVHKKVGTRLKELHKASGGPWGGTSVNKKFLSLLESIVGHETMTKLRDDSMEDYLDLLREFEVKKQTILPHSADLVTIRVPVALRDIYEEVTGATVKTALKNCKIGDKLSWVGDKLRMDAEVARGLFSESITQTVSTVRKIIDKSNLSIHMVLMVGGYAECKLMQGAFRDNFEPDINVIIPMEAGLAILKGAVLFGHDPSLISSRILRYTYGVNRSPLYDPKIHPVNKRDDSYNPPRCKDVFFVYAKAGSSVDVGHKEEGIVEPLTDSQETITTKIFRTPERNPRFTTDLGCIKIGEYSVKLPPYEGKQRNYREVVTFGDTKIHIMGTEPTSGEEFETTVDFLG